MDSDSPSPHCTDDCDCDRGRCSCRRDSLPYRHDCSSDRRGRGRNSPPHRQNYTPDRRDRRAQTPSLLSPIHARSAIVAIGRGRIRRLETRARISIEDRTVRGRGATIGIADRGRSPGINIVGSVDALFLLLFSVGRMDSRSAVDCLLVVEEVSGYGHSVCSPMVFVWPVFKCFA